MADGDELERIAERGRRIAERGARREAERDPSHREDGERAAARRRLRASISHYVRWGWWLVGGLATALAVGGVFPRLFVGWHDSDLESGLAVLVGALLLAAAWALRAAAGERAITREEAWARSHPFPIAGYFEAIADSVTEGVFVIDFTFDEPRAPAEGRLSFRDGAKRLDPPPDAQLLADVFRSVRAEVRSGEREGVVGLERRWDFETSVSSNAHARAWVHEVVPVLVALHARHPIREARVHGFRPRP